MRPSFAKAVLDVLVEEGPLEPTTDSVVALCAGEFDRALFDLVGFRSYQLTNLSPDQGALPWGKNLDADLRGWLAADAHDLPFDDGSFDWAWVSDGIHHCHLPHLAVAEMLRVARKGIIVLESRDSAAMRLAQRLHYSHPYEINTRLLATRTQGGTDFGPVPNFVYRWTEREFEKLVRCVDPARTHDFSYFYGLAIDPMKPNPGAVEKLARAVARVAPRQGNCFGMVAVKGEAMPYLDGTAEGPRLRDEIRTKADARVALRGLPTTRRRRHTIRNRGRWDGWPEDARPIAPKPAAPQPSS